MAYEELVLRPGAQQLGRVQDGDGLPVAGAEVTLASIGETALADQRVQTDAQGIFRIAAAAPGRYSVSASHENLGQSQGDLETLPQPTLTLTLRRGVTVRGEVVDEQGNPARAAVVRFGRKMLRGGAVTTDAAGAFALEICRRRRRLRRRRKPPPATSAITEVNITTGAQQAIVLVLRGGRIAGRVVDANGRPVEHARL